jgi:hypothetical protein
MITAQLNDTTPFRIVGDWGKQANRLKRIYPQLTDFDLRLEPFQEFALIYRLQIKLRMKFDQAIVIVKQGMYKKD